METEMDKYRLDLDLLLPDLEEGDKCEEMLTGRLAHTRGVSQAHIVREDGHGELCLHYDPNLVSLSKIQRMAEEAGVEITSRYRHEAIPLENMMGADAAASLTRSLESMPGMLHANANYAAGLAFVAYDTQQLSRVQIEDEIRRRGFRVREAPTTIPPVVAPITEGDHDHEAHDHEPHDHAAPGGHAGHDHGSAPGFLPHWVQERWTLILVALAGVFLLIGWVGETFFGMAHNVALVFYILSYIAGGYDIATEAIPGLFRGRFDTDVLMLAAATGAALLGEWPEGAFLLFLFSLGHAGEHYALDRARDAVGALGKFMPSTAMVRRNGEITEEPVDALQIGDVVVVRPGDRVPVDGLVLSGQSSIDQSPITGESAPVNKAEGDEVFAGTTNQTSALDVQVSRLAKDNTLSRVMQMVAEAQSQQSPTQRFTDRFTAWFVPAILIFVLAVIAIPPLMGWMPLEQSFYRGMLLLVASSPCALAIGTPASVLSGIAQAARNGVLIKGGVHLENLGGIKVMAFDKTGTLTQGKFQVTDVIPMDGTGPDALLSLAAAVEQQSNHPLALAVVDAAQEKQLSLPQADGLENVAGRGVRSQVDGQPVLIGSLKLFQETDGHGVDDGLAQTVAGLEAEGKTTMVISQDGRFLGILALADAPRDDVPETMEKLRNLGVEKLIMLTGDNEEVARRIGDEVGVTDVEAELMPEQKLEIIKRVQEEYGSVAMTGDGVNDAPALATATVGIAMGGAGTAVALETADVALMADDLSKLPFAVGLSRASRSIIKQNLGISLGIIAILIVTSLTGIMELPGAVIFHEGSTIVVVLNALRLLRYNV